MERFPSFVLFFGIIVAIFLLWHAYGPAEQFRAVTQKADNAETEERCAEFREELSEEDGIWSLGYAGRFRQFVRGCF